MDYIIPGEDKMIEVMEMMFGEGAAVKELADDFESTFSASFINPDGDNVASCDADIRFASFAGAAFSMLPADVAQEFVDDGEVSAVVKDNLYEVMNIFSALLMNDDTPHLKLRELGEEEVVIDSEPTVQGYTLTVPGYGEGNVRFNIT